MKETPFKKWFIPEMKKRGYPFVRKYMPTGNAGTVDLIACIDGLFFGIELKQAKTFADLENSKKGLKPLQKVERSEIVFCGGVHIALGSVRDGRVLISIVWDYGRRKELIEFSNKYIFIHYLTSRAKEFHPGNRHGQN